MSEISVYQFAQLDTSIAADRSPGDVLSAAWAEAETIREQARAEGYAAGHEAGLTESREQLGPLLESLSEAVGAVKLAREELIETLTRQAAEVSLGIADQILATAVKIQPERVVDVARGALRRLGERHKLTLVVNPADRELVADAIAVLRSELGGIEHLDVQTDRRIERGGCVVKTEYGEIDARVSTQFAKAREVVTAALAGDTSLSSETQMSEHNDQALHPVEYPDEHLQLVADAV